MARNIANRLELAVLNQRQRFLAWAAAAIVGVWLAAWAGHWYFESLKMTADKVRAYVESVNLSQLTGAARAKAIKELEDKLNALSYEERQRLRSEHLINGWFEQMTEPEKEQFVEATLPTGFKQMINAFQQLPDDKRRQLIDNAMKNLRTANNRVPNGNGTNAPSALNPELEAKIRTIGLKSFYSQSSAETKAELAPFLEALQRQMESGRTMLRRQRQ
jgi:molecular chaperone DnaK (HSP70)